MERVETLIVGAGFYGCNIALHLKRQMGLGRILIADREERILARASYGNQARVHNGYHYPRSFTTAYRSRNNYRLFNEMFQDCIYDEFVQIYAIARRNSVVTAAQFEHFCREIGAPCHRAAPEVAALLSPRLIEQAFEVPEVAFDANRLRNRLQDELRQSGISVDLQTAVTDVREAEGGLVATLCAPAEAPRQVRADRIFNCTYAGLNSLGGGFGRVKSGLKFEVTEIGLIRVPEPLQAIGITVLDGPFFSVMPFPARGVHSLSHVRYTPHIYWTSEQDGALDPYRVLDDYPALSRTKLMLRDASRYLPLLASAEPLDSIFEIKTVLTINESDDGRPILFEQHPELPNAYSLLGGKIDNIFDVFKALTISPTAPHG